MFEVAKRHINSREPIPLTNPTRIRWFYVNYLMGKHTEATAGVVTSDKELMSASLRGQQCKHLPNNRVAGVDI